LKLSDCQLASLAARSQFLVQHGFRAYNILTVDH
jgi:hypothetical protein